MVQRNPEIGPYLRCVKAVHDINIVSREVNVNDNDGIRSALLIIIIIVIVLTFPALEFIN